MEWTAPDVPRASLELRPGAHHVEHVGRRLDLLDRLLLDPGHGLSLPRAHVVLFAVSRRERKVVTVLFCDLVGFTSQAESMDPEDVEALQLYHERLRAELERHGGTVEKFIGDAVMALFGAPVTHEDDPERASGQRSRSASSLEDELELRDHDR